jgi:transposase
VIAGIDTHKDTLAVAVIDAAGKVVATREFRNVEAGFDAVQAFFREHDVARVGIEGSGNYGRGAALRLVTAGEIGVVEVPPSLTARERASRPGRGRSFARIPRAAPITCASAPKERPAAKRCAA